MPILTSQFNDLVKNALVQWREEYESVPEAARLLYDVVPNENLTSEHSQIDSPGFAKRKDQGGSFEIGSPRQGYTLNLTKFRSRTPSSRVTSLLSSTSYRSSSGRRVHLIPLSAQTTCTRVSGSTSFFR